MVVLFIQTKFYLFKEELKCRRLFYSNQEFKKVDGLLRRSYLFCNPYSSSRKYLQTRGEQEVDTYGETPLTTLHLIAKKCQLSPTDQLIEMGSGRGRGAFFLSHYFGCSVHGVERIPLFVTKANEIIKKTGSDRIQFTCGEMQEVDLSFATVIYLYGSCLEEEEILNLIQKFDQLSSHVKIITVSYPLTDYSAQFKVVEQFAAPFPWGEATVYLNIKGP